jgi:ABC-2 type transport system ATP-binding protein
MKAVIVNNLSKMFNSFNAVKELSFHINEGQCVGLLGTNGAGKSTTIKTIIGQLKPTSGHVEVFGVNPTTSPKEAHQFIGYIPDNQTIYEDITVKQNIDVFRKIHGLDPARTDEIIEQIELSEKINTKVKDLSKGLRQRVLIARALIHNPKLILLDEPTTGLDPSSANSIYQLLEKLKKEGSSILLTTHLMNDVERLCDHVVFLDKGQKVEEGSPGELKDRYRNQEVEIKVKTSDGQKLTTTTIKDLKEEINNISSSDQLYSVNTHEPRLEEIFMSIIKEQK